SDQRHVAIVMDLLLKRSLVHINQSRVRDASPTLCGAGEGWHRIPYHARAVVWYSSVVLTKR
ncbi:MAG: hypothetical protein ACREIG_03395, partial [Nitrospiraceae bacterium]